MRGLIDREAFYKELNKSSVRNNFTEDDFDYIQHLLFIQPFASEPMQWISVKDKEHRPEDGEQVWCYGSGYYFTAYYDEVQETDYGLNPFGFYELRINPSSLGAEDEEYIESCATHWMPLPEPPKGENE